MKALSGDDFIEIKKMQLSYFSFSNLYGLSCLGYYQGSLDAITSAMEENLEIIHPETIKTFSYDYSVDYEQDSEIIGKGIYSGGKVPDSSVTNPIIPNTPDEDDSANESIDPDDEDISEDPDINNPDDEDPTGDPSIDDSDENDDEDTTIPGNPEKPTEDPDSSNEENNGNDSNDENSDVTPGEPTVN